MEELEHPTELKFTYKKGNFYRVVHVDGAFGSLGPSGRYINMSLWSERRTLPKEHVFGFLPDGSLDQSTPLSTVDIGGVFREIEVCATMDIFVAKALVQWLENQIGIYDKLHADARHSAAGGDSTGGAING